MQISFPDTFRSVFFSLKHCVSLQQLYIHLEKQNPFVDSCYSGLFLLSKTPSHIVAVIWGSSAHHGGSRPDRTLQFNHLVIDIWTTVNPCQGPFQLGALGSCLRCLLRCDAPVCDNTRCGSNCRPLTLKTLRYTD